MAERELKTTPQWPIATTPLSGEELVEIWKDGKQYYVPFSELGGMPAAHSGTHKHGGDDEVGTLDNLAYGIPKLDADGLIDSRVSDASTTTKGKVQLATSGEEDATKPPTSTDSRLKDARPPTVHASQHIAGTDVIDDATVSNSGLMSAADKVKADATIPAYIPTADQKAALAGTEGTASGTNKYVTDEDGRIPSAGEKAALAGTAGTPSALNPFVTDSDSRLSDDRDPTEHAASHVGGADPISQATTSNDGLMTSTHVQTLTDLNTISFDNLPTDGEKAALVGTGGTPDASNPFVTDEDARLELIPSAGEKAALVGSYGTPSAANRFITESDPVLSSIGGGSGGGTGVDLLGIGKIGNGVSISIKTSQSLAYLSATEVALFGTSDHLAKYSFDGSDWSLVGNVLSISGFSSHSCIGPLTSTDIVLYNETSKELATYRFDGTNWAKHGNGFSLLLSTSPTIAKLSSSEIAIRDAGSLAKYSFDGSDWSLVGNVLYLDSLGMDGNGGVSALTSTDVAMVSGFNEKLGSFCFDGTNWSNIGVFLDMPGIDRTSIASISATDIALIDDGLEQLSIYRFNGSVWAKVGKSLTISGTNYPSIAMLTESTVAVISAYNDELRTYNFLFGYDSASINIVADYEVPEIATGKSIVIRRTSAYDGNPVTITPPSGATFEGRASLSLYGQYSFVELERISSTVFAIKEREDGYAIIPTISFDGNSVGVSYSSNIGEVCISKNQALVNTRVLLNNKGTSEGRLELNLVGAPASKPTSGNITPGSIWYTNISTEGYFQSFCLQGANKILFDSVLESGSSISTKNTHVTNTMLIMCSFSYPI